MTMVIAICVAVTFAVSIYLMLGRELKGVAMGVFLLGHAANLSIIAMSGSPVPHEPAHDEQPHAVSEVTNVAPPDMKSPPVLATHDAIPDPLSEIVDPLPQALILTAIVIGFGVMAFLLTLLVVTNRKTHTIEISELAQPSEEEAQQA